MEDYSEEFRRRFPAIFAIQQQMKPAIELQKQLEPFLKNQGQVQSIYREFEKIQKIANRIRHTFESLPSDNITLSTYGWYLELECESGLARYLMELLDSKGQDSVDSELVSHYRDSCTRILKELKQRHPNRQAMFLEISKGLENERYLTTIPLMLMQIDGITNDIVRQSFFQKLGKEKDFTSKAWSEIQKLLNGDFENGLFAALSKSSPILANEHYLDQFPCKLNRHRILHGTSMDYGTEINTLKILSLLKLISDALCLEEIN